MAAHIGPHAYNYICNKNYCGPRNINTIHKGDWCMWNMIVAYDVLAFSVLSMKVLCDMAIASIMHGDLSRVNYYV